MKYKKGDTVFVRPDLNLHKRYYEDGTDWGCGAVYRMLKYAGKRVTITEEIPHGYRIEGDHYGWVDEMFTGLADTPTISLLELLDKNRPVNVMREAAI